MVVGLVAKMVKKMVALRAAHLVAWSEGLKVYGRVA